VITRPLFLIYSLQRKMNPYKAGWIKRFKTARDIFGSQLGGPLILTKIVEMSSGYDKSDEKKVRKCQEKAFETFLAFLYLGNADRGKGSLLSGLNTQHSQGKDPG
jgi:hypothetical protein